MFRQSRKYIIFFFLFPARHSVIANLCQKELVCHGDQITFISGDILSTVCFLRVLAIVQTIPDSFGDALALIGWCCSKVVVARIVSRFPTSSWQALSRTLLVRVLKRLLLKSLTILDNPDDTSFGIGPLIHGSMKNKLPELELAIDGYITPEQAAKLKIIKEHFGNLEARKAELEELILALANPYQQEISIILTAPGFTNTFTAIGIISEIGTNMEAFPSAKHLCSWAGLTPANNESAGKKKSVRVSKDGCYIKPLLVQCANAAIKSKKHPEIRDRYLRIKKRRGHKKAIIAIARMLLTALYHMLKNGENYNSDLYQKSDILPTTREITVEQAILMAQFQGYRIKSATE